MIGKIVKQVSNDYTVKSDKLYICKARGKFRNIHVTPLVGDNVEFDPDNKVSPVLTDEEETDISLSYQVGKPVVSGEIVWKKYPKVRTACTGKLLKL